jgi:hypothetical protein
VFTDKGARLGPLCWDSAFWVYDAFGVTGRRKSTNRRGEQPNRLPLAPLDPLAREIQKVLQLIEPFELEGPPPSPRYDGYCGAATEAYLHLAGGRDSGLQAKRKRNRDGSSHWWLEGPRGVIDVTLSAADRRALRDGDLPEYDYHEGRGAMFQNGYGHASKRAQAIIDLVKVASRRTASA